MPRLGFGNNESTRLSFNMVLIVNFFHKISFARHLRKERKKERKVKRERERKRERRGGIPSTRGNNFVLRSLSMNSNRRIVPLKPNCFLIEDSRQRNRSIDEHERTKRGRPASSFPSNRATCTRPDRTMDTLACLATHGYGIPRCPINFIADRKSIFEMNVERSILKRVASKFIETTRRLLLECNILKSIAHELFLRVCIRSYCWDKSRE